MQHIQPQLELEARWQMLVDKRIKVKWFYAELEYTSGWSNLLDSGMSFQMTEDEFDCW